MMTLEIKEYGDFEKDNVFRISIVNDDVEGLDNADFSAYGNLHSILLENNRNLTSLDLRDNTSVRYLCLGTCDKLTTIRLDGTNIETIDLYDLIALETVELSDAQLLNLKALLSENITKQFLTIEDAILEGFERRIAATEDAAHKAALSAAYDAYLDEAD